MGRDIEDGKTQRHGRDSNELEIEKARWWWWWWSRIFLSFLEKLSIFSARPSSSLYPSFFPPLSRVGKKENPAIINRTLFHDTRGEPREEKVLDVG